MEIKTTEKQRAFQICLNSVFIVLHMSVTQTKVSVIFYEFNSRLLCLFAHVFYSVSKLNENGNIKELTVITFRSCLIHIFEMLTAPVCLQLVVI